MDSNRNYERDPPDKVEDEIPADILAKVEREQENECDVTDKIELKLKECA